MVKYICEFKTSLYDVITEDEVLQITKDEV